MTNYGNELISKIKSLGIFVKVADLKENFEDIGNRVPACLVFEGDITYESTTSRGQSGIRQIEIWFYVNQLKIDNYVEQVKEEILNDCQLNDTVLDSREMSLELGTIVLNGINYLEPGIYKDQQISIQKLIFEITTKRS